MSASDLAGSFITSICCEFEEPPRDPDILRYRLALPNTLHAYCQIARRRHSKQNVRGPSARLIDNEPLPFGIERPYFRNGSGFLTGATTSRRKRSFRTCIPATLSRPFAVADDEVDRRLLALPWNILSGLYRPNALLRAWSVFMLSLRLLGARHLPTTRESSSPANFDQRSRGGASTDTRTARACWP